MDCVELSAEEFMLRLRSGTASEALSPIAGVAMAIIDFRSGDDGDGPAIRPDMPAATMPCVLVGRVTGTAAHVDASSAATPSGEPHRSGQLHRPWEPHLSWASGCDVIVSEDAEIEELRTTVLGHPLAACALALLLRGQAGRTVEEGLVAESTVYSLLQSGPEFGRWRASRPTRPPRVGTGPSVVIQRDDERLHITMSRPHVHNAFDRSVRDGLTEAFELALADDSIRAIVLDGEGPSFSSGGDLDEFGSFADPVSSHLTRLTRSPARLLRLLAERLGDQLEIRLHGACMGAGIELPAFASRIVAHPDSRLALPELRYGLIPGAGGTVSVTRRIGRHRSAYLGLTGRTIDAATALSWGLVDEVHA